MFYSELKLPAMEELGKDIDWNVCALPHSATNSETENEVMAEPLFNRYHITPKDVLFVISTSGINSVPVEMAQCGRRAGVPVIAIVSQAYAGDASRHEGSVV